MGIAFSRQKIPVAGITWFYSVMFFLSVFQLELIYFLLIKRKKKTLEPAEMIYSLVL